MFKYDISKHNYAPPALFDVGESEIHGRGLFYQGLYCDIGTIFPFPVAYKFSSDAVVDEELFPNRMIRTNMSGFINHNEKDPNVTFIPQEHANGVVYFMKAILPITVGDEITVDYSTVHCGQIEGCGIEEKTPEDNIENYEHEEESMSFQEEFEMDEGFIGRVFESEDKKLYVVVFIRKQFCHIVRYENNQLDFEDCITAYSGDIINNMRLTTEKINI